jgi:hypothetical protein
MARKPLYTLFWADQGTLKTRDVYEDSFEYWGPYAAAIILFFVSFITSGYFFFNQPLMDRLEYLVAPFTLVVIIQTSMIRERPLIFMPTFIVGCVWALTSLLFDAISFDIATYVFCYCATLIVVAVTLFLNYTLSQR